MGKASQHCKFIMELEFKVGDIASIKQIKMKRNSYLALSAFSLLFLGLIYAFSMFAQPMCDAFSLEKSDIGLTFNIMMIAFCCGCVAGSQIEKQLGTKLTIVISAILFCAGFVGTALLANGNIFIVYILYGVLGGAGVGIGYNSIIATTNIWFPDKVGFSSGVLMMGFGLGSLILGSISVKLIPIFNLSTVFMFIGIATLVVVFLCAFTLRRPPENITELMQGPKASKTTRNIGENDSILKSKIFYIYCIWSTVIIAIGLATIGNCSSDAQLVGIDVGFATFLVGLVSTFNGLARVIMGVVYDKTNVKITMVIITLIAICATCFVVSAFYTMIPVLYICGALFCGFCYGSVPVVASAFTRQRFGQKHYSFNLSIANFTIVFGSLLNIVAQLAVGASNRMSIFILMGLLAIFAFADIIFFAKTWNSDFKKANED